MEDDYIITKQDIIFCFNDERVLVFDSYNSEVILEFDGFVISYGQWLLNLSVSVDDYDEDFIEKGEDLFITFNLEEINGIVQEYIDTKT